MSREVYLNDICRPTQWATIPITSLTSSGYPVYGANGIIGYYSVYNHEKPTLLITCRGATCGALNISQPFSYVTGNAMSLDDLDEEQADMNFLYYALKRRGFDDVISGTAQPQITRDGLSYVKISLPTLSEQKRIAALLGRADRLRQLRRTGQELGDTLLQSVFLEMFGDPAINSKNWKCASLGQACDEIYRYPTFYGFAYIEKGVPVIRIGNILLDGEVNPILSDYVFISPEINKRFPRTIIEIGDILMAVRGDGSTGKRIGMVKSKNLIGANISPNLIRFKANALRVNPFYLFYFMTSKGGQDIIEKYITRTAKKTITALDIKTIPIPVPPLDLQGEFAEVVRRVEGMQGRMGEADRQAEELFQGLLSQAFESHI